MSTINILIHTSKIFISRFVIEVTGEPFPSVTWYFNNTPIEPSPRIQIIFEESICTLLILNTVLEDRGTYLCEARNDSGVTTCTSTLHITRMSFFVELILYKRKVKNLMIIPYKCKSIKLPQLHSRE